ncbi:hypothetical protein BGZ93_001153 [Podila epicladia]|nr:hypothetical protein BGZ92_002455 [Podila epicladia]KAG0084608.1 hypothetical protein BGZ93_001153 [Podila epicladia]
MQEAEANFCKDLEALETTIDPMIQQYKAKAVDMALARFEKYQQRAIAEGFISPQSQPSISPSLLSTSTSDRWSASQSLKDDIRPLESSDIKLDAEDGLLIISVTDLVVKVLEPMKTEDDASNIMLPVTFRVRDELQWLKVIIPNNNRAKDHPAFSVAEAVTKKWVPINFKFKVSGVAIYSAYSMNSQFGFTSRLEKYGTSEDKEWNCKFVMYEMGTQMSALRKIKK